MTPVSILEDHYASFVFFLSLVILRSCQTDDTKRRRWNDESYCDSQKVLQLYGLFGGMDVEVL